MKTRIVIVLCITTLALVITFTFTSPIPTLTLDVNTALAQQSVTNDKSVLAQDQPKEVVPATLPEKKGLNPSSLIGEWKGQWESGSMRDRIYLTVKSIENGQVAGSVYIQGPARYHNRDLPIKGTVSEEGMNLANEYITLTLTFSPPNKLAGEGRGDHRASIELKK